jgi:hypothetical protein
MNGKEKELQRVIVGRHPSITVPLVHPRETPVEVLVTNIKLSSIILGYNDVSFKRKVAFFPLTFVNGTVSLITNNREIVLFVFSKKVRDKYESIFY